MSRSDGAGVAANPPTAAESAETRQNGTASAVPFWYWGAAVAILAIVACCRVALTYHVYSQTFDEPAHVACGSELLATHQYTLEPQHPPLARVVAAAGLALLDVPFPRHGTTWSRGNEMLYFGDAYIRNLSAARSGILIFLLALIAAVWLWTRELLDDLHGTIAVAMVTLTPAVLAHAGLATTDLAVAATTTWSLFCFWRWLREPTRGRSLATGVTTALAVASKFSAFVFVPAGAVAILLTVRPRRIRARQLLASAGWASFAFAVVLWAAYGFSPDAPRLLIDGVRAAVGHARGGHPAFLFGRTSNTSWWYFFLAAFLFKTPLAIVLLLIAGAVLIVRERLAAEALACVVVFFVATMPVRIGIGLRHLLPIYGFVAIVAAQSVVWLWRTSRHRFAGRLAVGILALWLVAVTTAAHPDYLPYFNELALGRPDRILVDSDLDWGQDFLRLAKSVDVRSAPLTLAYLGSADPRRHHLPPFHTLRQGEDPHGWIALSVTILRKGKPAGRFAWADSMPFAPIGQSIRLYYRGPAR